MTRSSTENCSYCGEKSTYLVGGFCSPVCQSQYEIYGKAKISKTKSRNCEECNTQYIAYQKRQRFCSQNCRLKNLNKHRVCLRKECSICALPTDHRKFKAEEIKKDLFS